MKATSEYSHLTEGGPDQRPTRSAIFEARRTMRGDPEANRVGLELLSRLHGGNSGSNWLRLSKRSVRILPP